MKIHQLSDPSIILQLFIVNLIVYHNEFCSFNIKQNIAFPHTLNCLNATCLLMYQINIFYTDIRPLQVVTWFLAHRPHKFITICKFSLLLRLRMCSYVVCQFTCAHLYSEGIFLHYQLASHCQILSQGCCLSITDYRHLLDLQPISTTPTIGCGNARIFVHLKLKIRISEATAGTSAFSQVTKNAVTSLKNSKCFKHFIT